LQQGATAIILATAFNDKVHALNLLIDEGANIDHQNKVIDVVNVAILMR
jgi:hypothetical protein